MKREPAGNNKVLLISSCITDCCVTEKIANSILVHALAVTPALKANKASSLIPKVSYEIRVIERENISLNPGWIGNR